MVDERSSGAYMPHGIECVQTSLECDTTCGRRLSKTGSAMLAWLCKGGLRGDLLRQLNCCQICSGRITTHWSSPASAPLPPAGHGFLPLCNLWRP